MADAKRFVGFHRTERNEITDLAHPHQIDYYADSGGKLTGQSRRSGERIVAARPKIDENEDTRIDIRARGDFQPDLVPRIHFQSSIVPAGCQAAYDSAKGGNRKEQRRVGLSNGSQGVYRYVRADEVVRAET